MEIKTALDAIQVCDKLRKDLSKIKYNPDLNKMLHNIVNMSSTISKTEVICRQTKNYSRLDEPIKNFTESAKHLEQLIFIATLMD